MPIGTSDGEVFKDRLEYLTQGVAKPKETNDNNVVTPDQVDDNKQKDKIQNDDLGGIPISDKGTITVRSLGNYDTQLTPEQETTYGQRYGSDAANDYDMRGYFKANPDVMPNAEGQHYPDTYKKPNHPTFSDESIYHGQAGNQGGTWGREGDKD